MYATILTLKNIQQICVYTTGINNYVTPDISNKMYVEMVTNDASCIQWSIIRIISSLSAPVGWMPSQNT